MLQTGKGIGRGTGTTVGRGGGRLGGGTRVDRQAKNTTAVNRPEADILV